METSMPQGAWKIKNTVSIGARARLSIQYSENIDEVIKISHRKKQRIISQRVDNW
jgi:hypothetical protein